MKSTRFFIALVLALLVSCGRPTKKNYERIQSPPGSVTYNDLLANGFTVARGEGVDVPILEKKVGDTLVYYQFDELKGDFTVSSMACQFPIYRKDSLAFADSVTLIGFNLKCLGSKESSSFLVQSQKNLFYRYSLTPLDSSRLDVLVWFDYPIF